MRKEDNRMGEGFTLAGLGGTPYLTGEEAEKASNYLTGALGKAYREGIKFLREATSPETARRFWYGLAGVVNDPNLGHDDIISREEILGIYEGKMAYSEAVKTEAGKIR